MLLYEWDMKIKRHTYNTSTNNAQMKNYLSMLQLTNILRNDLITCFCKWASAAPIHCLFGKVSEMTIQFTKCHSLSKCIWS